MDHTALSSKNAYLGVDTSLVSEGTETSHGVVEGNVDLDCLGNKILNDLELLKVVARLDVVGGGNNHARHETTKRSNTVTLTNTENRGIDMSGTSLTVRKLLAQVPIAPTMQSSKAHVEMPRKGVLTEQRRR